MPSLLQLASLAALLACCGAATVVNAPGAHSPHDLENATISSDDTLSTNPAASPATPVPTANTPTPPAAPAATPAAAPAAEELFTLSVIHLNDFHARFEQLLPSGSACNEGQESPCVGGIARVVTKAKELLEQRTNPLLLNAGDNFQGTLWFTLYGWNVTAQFLNYLPWDAVTLGNHEFDRGVEGVVPFIENLEAPVVVANMNDSKEPTIQGLYKKSIIVERGSRKIGIIGIITSTTKDISAPGELEFLPEAQAVAAEGALLKTQGVDIIVVLSHAGIEVDLQLAAEDPLVDVIVGGHSHTLLYNGEPPSGDVAYDVYPIVVQQDSGRKVAVVQAGAYSKYLGDLIATFDTDGELVSAEGNPVYLDSSVQPDAATAAAMEPWAEGVRELGRRTVGRTAVLLEHANGACGAGECNLGSFVADAMQHAYVDRGAPGSWTRVAVAITNSGGLRAPIAIGNVTYNDVMTMLPFANTIDFLEMSGAGLRVALEQAVMAPRRRGRRSGPWVRNYYGFLQVAGLHVRYDADAPAGSRLRELLVLCHQCTVPTYEPVKDDQWYPVTINNFLGGGGDGFYVFTNSTYTRNYEEGPLDADVLLDYFKIQDPVVQARDGRLSFVTAEEKDCPGGARAVSSGKVSLALVVALIWYSLSS